ncbi:hypothetical protein SS50377_28638 [Spironucleus salmonicida]|uniref:Uncharacterized protein n=1 Tax=Spironucleus salmonicida TaxID=348837 RepID=V6LLH1_9EUKA|nr:hypothetical protein SS50377_28638 [Spironucleus salmonicida]|eukprot:EST41539.1 Hypothetical protein SS50377_18876 [Spironucleus salmonicida]
MRRQKGTCLIENLVQEPFDERINVIKHNFQIMMASDDLQSKFLQFYLFKPQFQLPCCSCNQSKDTLQFDCCDVLGTCNINIDYQRILGSEMIQSFMSSQHFNADNTETQTIEFRQLIVQNSLESLIAFIPQSSFDDDVQPPRQPKIALQISHQLPFQPSTREVLFTRSSSHELKFNDLVQTSTSDDTQMLPCITTNRKKPSSKYTVLGPLQLSSRKNGRK